MYGIRYLNFQATGKPLFIARSQTNKGALRWHNDKPGEAAQFNSIGELLEAVSQNGVSNGALFRAPAGTIAIVTIDELPAQPTYAVTTVVK